MPAKQPNARAPKTPRGRPMNSITMKEANSMTAAEMNVELRSASAGSMEDNARIERMPTMEAMSPIMAMMTGRAMYSKVCVIMPAPMAMVAIMEPQ